jgi:hypothetical protein
MLAKLLLGETDRTPELVEHEVGTMVLKRLVGIALGYEDHDESQHDPLRAVLDGKRAVKRTDCAALVAAPR